MEVAWRYTGHTDRIRAVAWTGDWVFSASDDRTVRAWYAGGYGDPAKRAAQAIRRDREEGKVSAP